LAIAFLMKLSPSGPMAIVASRVSRVGCHIGAAGFKNASARLFRTMRMIAQTTIGRAELEAELHVLQATLRHVLE